MTSFPSLREMHFYILLSKKFINAPGLPCPLKKRQMIAKKAQSTIPVAVLIMVMLVFIIIYIISLPPKDRERLLNITTEEDKGFTGETVRVTVEADEFSFDPDRITVQRGDKLIITFENNGDISHNFGISEYGVRTDTIEPGEEDTITFIANKRGTFDFFCSVQGHKEAGMEGELEVE